MNIRKAKTADLSRVAEIYIFNNRVNYFPIFKDEGFYKPLFYQFTSPYGKLFLPLFLGFSEKSSFMSLC